MLWLLPCAFNSRLNKCADWDRLSMQQNAGRRLPFRTLLARIPTAYTSMRARTHIIDQSDSNTPPANQDALEFVTPRFPSRASYSYSPASVQLSRSFRLILIWGQLSRGWEDIRWKKKPPTLYSLCQKLSPSSQFRVRALTDKNSLSGHKSVCFCSTKTALLQASFTFAKLSSSYLIFQSLKRICKKRMHNKLI